MKQILIVSFLLIFILGACMPPAAPTSPPMAAGTLLLSNTETRTPTPHFQTVGELERIIWASDPKLPQYDPGAAAYAAFPEAVRQIAAMGMEGIDAADDLAVAITFPRADSYLAAQAIIALGPEITLTLLPILIDNLQNQKAEVRVYSVILLGFSGERGSCAAGNTEPLLWDPDPQVRTATALALEKIIGEELVPVEDDIAITLAFLADSIPADTPVGKIAGTARLWWSEQGSKVNWHPSYDLCDP
jgi:hypothetical protein